MTDQPRDVRDLIIGFALFAGGANVIMQLSRLPIGRGVAGSVVESGRVDRHPIKRLRTTGTYLVLAILGTDDERAALRREIDTVHAHVHSTPGEAVEYDAFDPDLQLWVAACLYKGAEDVFTRIYGRDAVVLDTILYPHAKHLATTLQVRDDMWPPDRDAFERYWNASLQCVEMDDVTRRYLQGIADLAFVVAPLGRAGAWLRPLLRPFGRFTTLGFLPEPFRRELGLPWSDRQQRRFDRWMASMAAVVRRLPRPLREFPLNLYLWDARRRIRAGRSVL